MQPINQLTSGEPKSGKIYLRVGSSLLALNETLYDAESLLQDLLASHPDLLAGDQMRRDEPRRWLLIRKEAGIPDSLGGAGRWALDHLFVDQEGVPTLVEVKRSTDTRLRREVVGQMLDYAANVVAHWPANEIQILFEERCRSQGLDAAGALADFLGVPGEATPPTDVELEAGSPADHFWQQVSDNLAAKRLRLVFVADVIPPELQRIIEYLNGEMSRTEVLAVEVKQFTGSDQQILVPRVIGQTVAAEDVKRRRVTRAPQSWDEDTFLDAVATSGGEERAEVVSRLISWMRSRGLEPVFGRGHTGPLYLSTPDSEGGIRKPFAVMTGGRVEILFTELARVRPFDQPSHRHQLKERLNLIAGVAIADEHVENATWPSINLALLRDDDQFARFTAAFDWVIDEVGRGQGA